MRKIQKTKIFKKKIENFQKNVRNPAHFSKNEKIFKESTFFDYAWIFISPIYDLAMMSKYFFCRNFCHLTEISVRFLRWPKTKKSQNLQISSKNFLWLQKFLRKTFFPKRYLMYKCKSYYNHFGRSRYKSKKK